MVELYFGFDWISRIDVFAVLLGVFLVWIGTRWAWIGDTQIRDEDEKPEPILPYENYLYMAKESIGLTSGDSQKAQDAIEIIDECVQIVQDVLTGRAERYIPPQEGSHEKLRVGDKTDDEYVEYMKDGKRKVHPEFRRKSPKEYNEYLQKELGYPKK